MRKLLGLVFLIVFISVGAEAADSLNKPATDYSSYNWTGAYAGLNVGGAWHNSSSASGVIGGGQAGYNYQNNKVVLGLEADIQLSSFSFSGNGSNSAGTLVISETAKARYFGTIRGRIGYAFGAWLPYFTGGLLYTTINHDGSGVTGVAGNFSASNNRFAGVLGGGVEWMFAPRWSAKVEYLWAKGSQYSNIYTTTTPNIAASYTGIIDSVGRFGINYHF
jgi:outer membrane immunogenic protein